MNYVKNTYKFLELILITKHKDGYSSYDYYIIQCKKTT